MLTLGVDLASQPERTATCQIRWHQGLGVVEGLKCGADDEALIAAIGAADKVGIDVPFGWPEDFVTGIAAYAVDNLWPLTVADPTTSPKHLQFRATDRHVHSRTNRWPLSVSCDRIAIPAMRAAALFTRLSSAGQTVARDGSGKVVEVYPAAALRVWQFDATQYKRKENRENRCRLLDAIQSRTASWLRLPHEARRVCEESDDMLDAMVAALVARAAAVGGCEPIPDEAKVRARTEGWIALPTATSLDSMVERLASSV